MSRIGDQLVGLLVDAVSDILTVTDDIVQPTPDVAYDPDQAFVKGLLPVDGRLISLVSLDRMLPEQAEAA